MVLVASFEYEKEKILLLTLGECALMGAHYIRYYWCYDVDKVNRTVVGKFLGMSQYTENSVTLQKVATMPSAQLLISFLYTMFLVTFFIAVQIISVDQSIKQPYLEEPGFIILFNDLFTFQVDTDKYLVRTFSH